MIVNKALIAAAVLLFTAPVVPALAHDDYGDHVEHWRLHRDLSEAHYVRCLSLSGKLAGSLRVASSVLVASSGSSGQDGLVADFQSTESTCRASEQ